MTIFIGSRIGNNDSNLIKFINNNDDNPYLVKVFYPLAMFFIESARRRGALVGSSSDNDSARVIVGNPHILSFEVVAVPIPESNDGTCNGRFFRCCIEKMRPEGSIGVDKYDIRHIGDLAKLHQVIAPKEQYPNERAVDETFNLLGLILIDVSRDVDLAITNNRMSVESDEDTSKRFKDTALGKLISAYNIYADTGRESLTPQGMQYPIKNQSRVYVGSSAVSEADSLKQRLTELFLEQEHIQQQLSEFMLSGIIKPKQ